MRSSEVQAMAHRVPAANAGSSARRTPSTICSEWLSIVSRRSERLTQSHTPGFECRWRISLNRRPFSPIQR